MLNKIGVKREKIYQLIGKIKIYQINTIFLKINKNSVTSNERDHLFVLSLLKRGQHSNCLLW